MGKRGAGRSGASGRSDRLSEDLLGLASQLREIEWLLDAPPASVTTRFDELAAATELVEWLCASLPAAQGPEDGLPGALQSVHDALGRAAQGAEDPGALRSALGVTRARLADAQRLLVVAAAAIAP